MGTVFGDIDRCCVVLELATNEWCKEEKAVKSDSGPKYLKSAKLLALGEDVGRQGV